MQPEVSPSSLTLALLFLLPLEVGLCGNFRSELSPLHCQTTMASRLAEEMDTPFPTRNCPLYRRSPCQPVGLPFARPKESGT